MDLGKYTLANRLQRQSVWVFSKVKLHHAWTFLSMNKSEFEILHLKSLGWVSGVVCLTLHEYEVPGSLAHSVASHAQSGGLSPAMVFRDIFSLGSAPALSLMAVDLRDHD